MIDIKANGPGRVKVSEEAVAVIAGTAALEAEGIAGLAGHLAGDITGKLGRRNLSKGVAVAMDGEAVRISTDITVKPGAKIQEVALDVQQKIKSAIETMTGLGVSEVNVTVSAGQRPA
ncbi:MAG: Asp23/Gls24 family envelope stress response protein [Clostridiales bacterium]|jgi:uncharacterized alkaline shock family protein YloU|nr:Asp23/Gls24 family envelope stress response protein [Clostridiales bacterium]